MKSNLLFSLATASAFVAASADAQTFPGNGATGFGGPVGTGSLFHTNTFADMTITLNRGAGAFNDALVLYLDTAPGGFSDTSTFGDNGDGGREAISGANNGNPSRTVVNFPAGFGADYAIAIENGFIGAFKLASGGNGSLNFLFGQAQSGNNLAASYSISITADDMSLIGLAAGSGQTFSFVGSLISVSAYRSNETIGPSSTVPGDGAGNAGFNNPQFFSAADSVTLVPEPSSATLLAGALGFALLRFRRRAETRVFDNS